MGGGLQCQLWPELVLSSVLVDSHQATGTGVQDASSLLCSGSDAGELPRHVALSRAGASAVLRWKFILRLVSGEEAEKEGGSYRRACYLPGLR